MIQDWKVSMICASQFAQEHMKLFREHGIVYRLSM